VSHWRVARIRFNPACELIVPTPADAALDIVTSSFTRRKFRLATEEHTLPVGLRFGNAAASFFGDAFLTPLDLLPILQSGTVVITADARDDGTTSIMVALRSSSTLWAMNDRMLACMAVAVDELVANGLLIEARDPVPARSLPKDHPGRERMW